MRRHFRQLTKARLSFSRRAIVSKPTQQRPFAFASVSTSAQAHSGGQNRSSRYAFSDCSLLGIGGALVASNFLQNDGVKAASESTELEKLHDCEDPDIDIVFIHGLDGDKQETWKNDENGALFFDLLQADPKLSQLKKRIWSFGYPNSIFSGNRNAPMSLENMGSNFFSHLYHSDIMSKNTPILFIAHSMGGLVAKKAIVQSEKTANKPASCYGDMFDLHKRIRGIIFYGVPHRGSDVADLLQVVIGNNSWPALNPLSWLSSLFGYNPSLSIEELSASNMQLLALQKDFLNWAHKEGNEVNILSFIETRSEPFLDKMVVKEQTGRLLLPREEEILLPFCHSEICKPVSCDDLRYTPIRKYILKLVLGFQQNIAALEAIEMQKMKQINEDLKQRQLENERMKQEQIRLEQERQRLLAERNRIEQQKIAQQNQPNVPQQPKVPQQPTYSMKRCAWCNGHGSDRVRNSRCSACRGQRQIKVENPAQQCNSCKGRGHQHGDLRARCNECKGLGWWNAKL